MSKSFSLETVVEHVPQHDMEKLSLMTEAPKPAQSQPLWRLQTPALCAHLAVFLMYSMLALWILDSWTNSIVSKNNMIWSPANSVLEWEVHEFNSGLGHVGPYIGDPRPELDNAWSKLLRNMNIRLSLEDLKAVNRVDNAIELPDGPGYAGSLNVFHEIHCVRWLYKSMYQQYYFPNVTDAKREENFLHSVHCLNHLRKSAMCHGDVGIVTYHWQQNTSRPRSKATSHKCVNWELLANWAEERSINMLKPGYLVHPTLGPAFPGGDGEDHIHEP